MDVSDAKRLKQMVADQVLDLQTAKLVLSKKLVKPAVCCRAVGLVQAELRMSERRPCRALAVSRASMRYRSVRPVPTALLKKLKQLASEKPRWGYRQL